jgi:hypothetical protein
MLEDMATTVGHESIVSWQPHGEAFRVHMPEVFARNVMPRYFNQTKYKSFQRQLHIYGFHRINKGRDTGAYFHSMFVRNKKTMCVRMTRKKIKGKHSSNHAAGDPPNFYSSDTKTINVNNDQYQDRLALANGLLLDPRIPEAYTTNKEEKMGCSEHDPVSVFIAGSIDRHPGDEDKASLLNSPFTFNQNVTADVVPCSSSHQRIGSEDIFGLLIDDWLDGDDEEFFAGKRFFHVKETENTVDESFSSLTML